MRPSTCLIFLILSACIPRPDQDATQVEYRITPQVQGNSFLVEIGHNGTDLTPRIDPDFNSASNYRLLPATHEYPIRYQVSPKNRGSMVSDTLVDLRKGYFQTTGHGLLACVGQDPKQRKSIQITWNAKSNWQFASSFPNLNFEANCYNLRDALYVGGHSPRLTIQKTWFGKLAHWGYSTPTLGLTLTENLKRVQEFWGSSGEPYHFISIRYLENIEAEGGTAQFQSFQLVLKPTTRGLDLDRLITHEYFHNWNGLKINLSPSEDPFAHLDIWWFIEGFTDYYAYWLVFKGPEKSQPGIYADSFKPRTKITQNMPLFMLKHYSQDPAQRDALFHIPYVHGRRFAAKLDQEIYRYTNKTKRLEHVMKDLIERSKNPLFYLNNENIVQTLCEGNYLSCEMATSLIKRYVIDGEALPIPTNPLI